MSLDRIANITILLEEPPIALASFSVPLVCAVLTTDQATAFGSDRTLEVTPDDWQDELEELGVTSSEDLWVCLSDLFGQDLQPDLCIIGRRATPVAQVNRVDIAGFTNGNYTCTINGTAVTYAASGAADAAAVRDGLIAAIQASAQAPNVTASISDADSLLITADEAGVSFTLSVSSTGAALTSTNTVANVGLVEDLVAIQAERDDWYYVIETTRSSGVIRRVAEYIETLRKYFVAQTDDSAAQAAGSTDIGSVLGAQELVRTATWWHSSDDEFVDAAIVGKMATKQPGSATWANKSLASVTGIRPTSTTLLASKHYNWLERFEAAGFSMSQGGWSASGQWTDLVVGRDWLHNLIQISVITFLRNSDKVPMTQGGANGIAAVMRTALETAADVGLVVRGTISVSVPTVSELDEQVRAGRTLPDVRARARLQGAIHGIDATVRLGN